MIETISNNHLPLYFIKGVHMKNKSEEKEIKEEKQLKNVRGGAITPPSIHPSGGKI